MKTTNVSKFIFKSKKENNLLSDVEIKHSLSPGSLKQSKLPPTRPHLQLLHFHVF